MGNKGQRRGGVSRRSLVLPALAFSASGGAVMAAGDDADLARVRERLRESLLTPPADEKATQNAETSLKTMQADGSWPDVVYSDVNRENWKAWAHMPRLMGIAKLYYQADSPWKGRGEVRDRIATSLGYWLRVDPKNDNWWYNQIGVPLQVGNLLILMGNDASPELIRQGASLMTRAGMEKMTGQNLVWTAQITVTRGCVTNQPHLVAGAYRRMWDEVRWAKLGEEGIQRDASFHQHGPLIYSGGYGQGFTTDVARFSSYARETRFTLPPDKRAILDAYVLDGQQWMLRGGQWDYGVTGRELIRAGKSAGGMVGAVRLLSEDPGPRQQEMKAFAARLRGEAAAPALSGNRHYWLSDYMAHQRPGYFAATHMFSTRMANTDGLTNGENKTSHHIADGAMYLAQTGQEYVGIYPVWDWHRIPGTTVEQNTPLDPHKVRRMGTTRFVGGVSDGTYGVAAMDLATDELRAKKAWFYFDREIVCLGAGITCSTANPIYTSVNQCLLSGPVKTSADPSGELPRGDHALKDAPWVWHDRVGYVPLGPGALQVRNDAQMGSLSLLGPWSPHPITKDIFSIGFDHGATPRAASYAYLVAPAVTAEQTARIAATVPVEVARNTAEQQAVWHRGVGVAAVVFHLPGTVSVGEIGITADNPCVLLARRTGKAYRVAVANPENAPLTVNVTIMESKTGRPRSLRFDLPDGWEAGRSVIQTWESGA